MKLESREETQTQGNEVIACFGKAALLKQANGTWRLKGGSQDDRLTAREWISLFLHEAVLQRD